jgi:hypothetical protein
MTRVLLPRIKDLDHQIAHDVLGVQPMTGSTNVIFTMKFHYSAILTEKKFGWQNSLDHLSAYYYNPYTQDKDPYTQDKDCSEFKIMTVIAHMQEIYPGNYILEEYYDSDTKRHRLRMVFDSPEEESMFIMRYSE